MVRETNRQGYSYSRETNTCASDSGSPMHRRRPRIAFIDCLLGTGKEGGADIATRELSRQLADDGLDVSILSFSRGVELKLPSFLKLKPLVRELLAFPLAGKRAMKQLASSCDIIHINSLALAPLHRPDIPLVVSLHTIQTDKFSRRWSEGRLPFIYNPVTVLPFRWMESKASANIDHFLPVSRSMEMFLVEKLLVPPSRVTRIPNGVDTDLFRPSPRKEERVIFVGRATTPKGFHTLLEAAPSIRAPILVLTNKIRKKTLEKALRVGMEIKFNLHREELARELSSSRLLVLPSWDEEQPLSVIEAMSCGLPVVTTPEGASDLVRDGHNGLVVPPGDSRALARAINYLVDKPELAESMGKEGRRLAEENHAWPKVTAKIKDVYFTLLG